MKTELTVSRLRELLQFEPETGVFTHREARQRVVVGARAGGLGTNGYRKHRVLGLTVREHTLAWFYVHGEWPKGQIDHINGVRDDNRIANLRDVDCQTNRQNLRKAIGSVGMLGVSKHRNRYVASIGHNSQDFRLGSYTTPEEAHSAYIEAKRRMHAGCTI